LGLHKTMQFGLGTQVQPSHTHAFFTSSHTAI
jgi:hypothetical protein